MFATWRLLKISCRDASVWALALYWCPLSITKWTFFFSPGESSSSTRVKTQELKKLNSQDLLSNEINKMILHTFYVKKMPLLNSLLVDKNNINKILKYDKLCYRSHPIPTDKDGVKKNSRLSKSAD